jgi:hypothetical protein
MAERAEERMLYEVPPISMKLRQFHDGISSSFKSMKLANGNHDSIALPRLRVRREGEGLGWGAEMRTSSSSSRAAAIWSSSSSSFISIKSSSARPSRDASALSWLARRSAELMEWLHALARGVRDDEDATEVAVMGASDEISCSSGMNEKRSDGKMGGKTGGPSNVDLGTSGGAALGTGFGDGIGRNGSPDALRMGE